jgi:ribonuclease HI
MTENAPQIEVPKPPNSNIETSFAPPAKRQKLDDSTNQETVSTSNGKTIAPANDTLSSTTNPGKTDDLKEHPDPQYIYTDGACSSNGTTAGRAGIGIFHSPNDPRNISACVPGLHQTNQHAELFAVLKALEQLYHQETQTPSVKRRKVVIRTDSSYVIKALTTWIQKWERNGWRSKANQPVVSKDLFVRAREMLRTLAEGGVRVSFEHVRGHMGVWGNEQADRLAVSGAQMEVEGDEWDEFEDEDLEAVIWDMEREEF